MAAQTQIVHLTNTSWTEVSVDKANIKVENPNTQPIWVAVAASSSDLTSLDKGHVVDFKGEKNFNNLASNQNIYLKSMNSGDSWAVVTATDARLASGGAPQTGLTDAQLRATPVPVTVDESNPIAVTGTFWQAEQPVSLATSTIIGATSDAAAVSDTATASLIALTKRTNQNITALGTKTPALGRAAASASSPMVLSNEDLAVLGPTNEALPASDTSVSGQNGLLKRIATNITTLTSRFPSTLGSQAASTSWPVTGSTEDVARIGSITETAPVSDIASSGLNGRLQRVAQNVTAMSAKLPTTLGRQGSPQSLSVALSTGDQALFGENNDTPPANDTDSAAINGRLIRIAQNITTLTGKFPASLGRAAAVNSSPSVLSNEDFAALGATNETAPVSDTATSGINGRLQRVAQRLTTISGQIPTTLGQKTGSNSLSVILASDQPNLTITSSNTGTVNAANSTTANLLAGGVFTGTAVDISAYGSVSVSVFTSHASGTDGFVLQQSTDNVNWDFTDSYTVAAGQTKINVPRQAMYFRVVYTNGATATTSFRLQTILNNQMPRGSSVRPGDAMTLQNDYDQTIAVPSVYNGTSFDLTRAALNGLNSVGTGLSAAQLVAQFDDVSVTAKTENSFGNVRMSQDGILYTASSPTASAGGAITPVSTTAVAASQVLKAAPGNLYGLNVCTGATSGYIMLFNATSLPANGTVTPVKVLPIAANAGVYLTFEVPLRFSTGIVAAFSSTGPFTLTASATAFISGDAI